MAVRAVSVARVVLTVSALVGALSACGSSTSGGGDAGGATDATAVYDKFRDLSGQERTDALVAAAKEEGGLTIYTSNSDITDTIAPAFEEKYGLTAEVYRASNEGVVQRALQESETNRPTSDLIETDIINLDTLTKADAVVPYESSIADELPETSKTEQWVSARATVTLAVRNTDLVPDSEVPASFEELADPRWKGKLSMESSDSTWYLTMYQYYKDKGMSDEEFSDMFKAIAANSNVVNGHPTMQSLLSAGEHAIAVSGYAHLALDAQEDGAPTSLKPSIGPVISSGLLIGLMKDAPHPASALLFIDYYLTDGQQLVVDANRQPGNPDAVPGYESPFPPDAELISKDHETMAEQGREWAEAYNRLLQGGDDVLP